MKKFILSIGLISVVQALQAQMPNHHWTRTANGGSSAVGKCMVVDAAGNVYTAGEFGGTSDFDNSAGVSNLTSNGANDIFLVKTNPQGDFLWAKGFGGSGTEVSSEIVLDLDGNVYLTGTYQGTADFNPDAAVANLTSAGMADVFILKVDPNGALTWAKSVGGTQNDAGNAIDIDLFDGSVFVIGSYSGTMDVNPGAAVQNVTSNGGTDVFMLKLSASGDYITSKTVGSISADRGNDIVIDATTGDQFMTGMFGGTTDFDPGIPVAELTGSNDVFVLKLNESNEFVFAKKMGGVAVDEGRNIAIDANGFIYVHGSFISTCNFDPNGGTTNVTSNGSDDVFVVQLSPAGALNWVKTVGSVGTEDFMDMDVNSLGQIYLTGEMANDMDANPDVAITSTLTRLGAEDTYLISLSSSGVFSWATSYGASNVAAYTRAYGIYVDEFGNVYATGSFNETVDFNPAAATNTITAVSGSDIWYQKLGPGTNSLSENQLVAAFTVSPNPSNGLVILNGDFVLENAEIKISNLRGEAVQSIKGISGQNISVDLVNHAKGIYLIEIVMKDFREVVKVIKE